MSEILRNGFDQCCSRISSEELLCTMDSFVFVMLMQKLTNTLYEVLKKVIQMLFLKEYF